MSVTEKQTQGKAPAQDFFWSVKKGKVEINTRKYIELLESSGFGKYYIKNDYVFIRVTDNKVEEVSKEKIVDFVLGYVKSQRLEKASEDLIMEKLLEDVSTYFKLSLLETLTPRNISFRRDKKDEAHFYFKNGFVTVNKEGFIINDYKELDGLVWKSQILERDFKEEVNETSDFERFLKNVAKQDENRFSALRSTIGYMLHSYKDSSKAKAVILLDEKVSDDPSGRSGKSLFSKALSKLRQSVRLDGKSFKFDKEFAYQQIELSTQILEFNDVLQKFDFERLFSVTTDSMTVEKKRGHAFSIPFDESPKIIISTNYSIAGSSDSYRARMHELEFSDFYNADHEPKDDFKKLFFDEWNEAEWTAFDKFMLECVRFYLENGLIEQVPINLQLRKLIDSTSSEFVSFMDEKLSADPSLLGIRTDKTNFYQNFTDYSGLEFLKKNTLTKWLGRYCKEKGLDLKEEKSNCSQYFTILAVKK